MQFQWTEKDSQNYYDYRLNYCGVCKAIGTLYNHESRLLLNRDIVFLAELITHLQVGKGLNENDHFTSPNCFILPETKEIPIHFRFLASINLILAEYKLLDDVVDEKGFKSNLSNFIIKQLSSQFDTASNIVIEMNFQLEKIRYAIENQRKVETERNLELIAYSANTGFITGEVFAHCFRLIQNKEMVNIGFRLGELFGQLIYIIDAIIDLETDWKKKRFNAIIASYNLNEPKLGLEQKKILRSIIKQKTNAINTILKTILKDKKYREEIIHRFQYNLSKVTTKLGGASIARQGIIFLTKRAYFKFISRVSFLIGLILFVILPRRIFFESKLVERIFKEISKDRTNKLSA